jgi:hypothetical protein
VHAIRYPNPNPNPCLLCLKLLQTATVTAHTIDIPQSQTDGHQSSVNSSPYKTKTVFLVKFDQEVMRREAQLT